MHIGVQIRKIYRDKKFTWLLIRLQYGMNENFNNQKLVYYYHVMYAF